jgi:hypoxanthine phosphoribosyltransferase
MKRPPPEVLAVRQRATEVVSAAAVLKAIDQLAVRMTLALADENPLLVCVMNGAVPFAGALLQRLQFPAQFTHVHVSRYGDATQGGELRWHSQPTVSLNGRHVVFLDDIFDQGVTLAALGRWALEGGAQQVSYAVLVDKQIAASAERPIVINFAALQCEDRFLIGYGMDYQGYWRNLPAIYAVDADAEAAAEREQRY